MNLSLPKFTLPALSNFSMAKGASAGLLIRTGEVEVLSLQAGKVAAHVRVPIEGGQDERLVQAITRAVGEAKLKTKRLAVSIASQDVLIRSFTMPVIPKSDWEMAAQFEVRKYIPFKIDSLVWDCDVFESSRLARREGSGPPPTDRLEVVFAGIPREMFRRFQSALSAAGVQPTVVEPLSLSLARLVMPKSAAANQFVCFVDVERDRAHLVIAENGIPYLTRDINLFSSGQASSPESAGGLVDQRAQRLVSELTVSIDFFTRENPSTTIAQVYLFGDEAILKPWHDLLKGQMATPVELGTALLTEQAADGAAPPLTLASAIGLLRGVQARGGASLNFLKRSSPVARPTMALAGKDAAAQVVAALKSPKRLAALGCEVAAVLALCWVVGTKQVAVAQQKLNGLLGSQPSVGRGLDGMTQEYLLPIQEKKLAQLTVLQRTVDGRTNVTGKLDALAHTLPEGVWLTSVNFDDRWETGLMLVIHGACYLGESGKELTAIQDFQERLKRNPALLTGFNVAQLDNINAQTDAQRRQTYRTFQVNCQSGQRL